MTVNHQAGWLVASSIVLMLTGPATAQGLAGALQQPILKPGQASQQHIAFVRGRVPALRLPKTAEQWQRDQRKLRQQVLENVIFRGVPDSWRKEKPAIVWLETIKTKHGYSLRKLRVEILPGLWIPAVLYEPDQLTKRVPVVLNVNGHDRKGKAVPYKQLRCINLAKRGMLALNMEWLGMGQLNTRGYSHNDLAKLDLCGTSGVSVFFLAMSRGLDVLLGHPHADPKRVAVTGLSGGGWQTIVLSSLDERVTLTVPVAGYSALVQRLKSSNSIGDLEQNPNDLVQYADYAHLTAMMVPRPTLLIYNANDNCCFVSSTVKPNTFDPVVPFFHQAGVADRFQYYENKDPGTHNYELDNRQQLYAFLNRHFFSGALPSDKEIPSDAEIRTAEELHVKLPAKNATFSSLATERASKFPETVAAQDLTVTQRRKKLQQVLRLEPLEVDRSEAVKGPAHDLPWELKRVRLVMGKPWTLPAMILEGKQPRRTLLWLSDQPWAKHHEAIEQLLQDNYRIICFDPVFIGHANPPGSLYQNAELISTVGSRPLGVQVAQVQAAAGYFADLYDLKRLDVKTTGMRVGMAALCAKAITSLSRIGTIDAVGRPASLKQLLAPTADFPAAPELYCFGLLQAFDVPELEDLAR